MTPFFQVRRARPPCSECVIVTVMVKPIPVSLIIGSTTLGFHFCRWQQEGKETQVRFSLEMFVEG